MLNALIEPGHEYTQNPSPYDKLSKLLLIGLRPCADIALWLDNLVSLISEVHERYGPPNAALIQWGRAVSEEQISRVKTFIKEPQVTVKLHQILIRSNACYWHCLQHEGASRDGPHRRAA